jgi:formylglycine-generating enzyme required for sulfatase activity
MATPQPPAPRVFVSHSHQDNRFCRGLVAALRAAGADVWYDEHNLGWGELRREIDRELPTRPYFVAILSPEAVASDWVNREIDAALDLMRTGEVRVFLPVIARPCSVPPTLRGFRRVDYTTSDASAQAALFSALGLRAPTASSPLLGPTPAPLPSSPSLPPERFPRRLADLGFVGTVVSGVEVILPPLCDVPAGPFLMGSYPSQDSQAFDDEKLQHWVTLAAYQLARFPVTVAEYACFVHAGHAKPRSQYNSFTWPTQLQRLDHPVVNVSWRDAVAYADWLANVTSQPWWLPSEAEWEKAARWDPAQRRARIYPWGDSFDPSRANTSASGKGPTTPVGSYPTGASPCGAQDMAGNVWEWTSSLYKPYPYDPDDGRERADSVQSHVLRGGSWYAAPRFARAAGRYWSGPSVVFVSFGFRLLRAVPGA